jgi:tetratricopeptide (TPR) repeat protein
MSASRRFLSLLLVLLLLLPAAVCAAETADQALARGRDLAKAGQHQQAVAVFDETIRLNPDHADAYLERGLSYHALRDAARAVADFGEYIRLRPEKPLGYALRGKAMQDMGKYQEALDDLSKALELDPGFALGYNDRGVIYLQARQYDKALADFTRAIDLKDIDLFMALTNRGACHTALGQPDKAFADFARALELNPRYEPAYLQRAMAYKATNQPASVVADLTAAIALNPQRPQSYFFRAEAYLKDGKPGPALADCQAVLRLAPHIYPAYWLMYEAYSQLGQQDNALRAIARYMNYAPLNDPRRAQAKQLLAQVQIKEIDPPVPIDRNPTLLHGAVAADGSAISGQERQAIRTGVRLMAAYSSKDPRQIREIDVRTRTAPDSQVAAVFANTKDWTLHAVEVVAYKNGVITARLVVSHEVTGSGRVGKTINHTAYIYRLAYVEGMWRAIQVTDEIGKDLFDTIKIAGQAAKRFGTENLATLKL